MKKKAFQAIIIINILNAILPIFLIVDIVAPGAIKLNQILGNIFFGYLMVSIIPSIMCFFIFLIESGKQSKSSDKTSEIYFSTNMIAFNFIINLIHILFYILFFVPLLLYMKN